MYVNPVEGRQSPAHDTGYKDAPKYIFVTGVLFPHWKRRSSLLDWLSPRKSRFQKSPAENAIRTERGSRYDEPFQHGEVFVTEDGAETDLDLGHYERFIMPNFPATITGPLAASTRPFSPKNAAAIISAKTVSGHPARHRRNQGHHQESFRRRGRRHRGDLAVRSATSNRFPFLEAIRQMRLELGAENTLFVHVTLVPFIAAAGELKTKPTQHSVKEMLSIGIQPDILLCRSDHHIPSDLKKKIALFCNVVESCVISMEDVTPLRRAHGISKEGLDAQILRLLKLKDHASNMKPWLDLVHRMHHPAGEARIAVVGNTFNSKMPTRVCVKPCSTAGWRTITRPSSNGLKRKKLIQRPRRRLVCMAMTESCSRRLWQNAAFKEWCTPFNTRANKVPFFGICLGMQCATI